MKTMLILKKTQLTRTIVFACGKLNELGEHPDEVIDLETTSNTKLIVEQSRLNTTLDASRKRVVGITRLKHSA